MPEGKEARLRERSISGDFEVCNADPQSFSDVLIYPIQDSDFESHAGDANPPGKPGRKKNPK